MKIYVASSWRNKYQQDVVAFLRSQGHQVYDFKNPPNKAGFGWESVSPGWTTWDTEEFKKGLAHPIAEDGFFADFAGMCWSDACVMVLPCGRSAHTEAGYFKGAGKKVIAYIPEGERIEPELMYKIFDGITSKIHEVHYLIVRP